ncbi:MAG TPA: hypothetical protein VHO26_11695 [Propionibacteriaceae bacterium]|nr:hypothetical protein [Propionibacteriaceae bacterium]
MSDQLIVVLGAIGLIVLVLAVTAGRWARSRSARAVLHGLGLALVIAALWIMGFLALVLAWVRATIHWVRTTPLDRTRLIGVVVGALGVLLVLVGSAVSPVSRAEARQRRQQRRDRAQAAQTGRPAADRRTPATGPGAATPRPLEKAAPTPAAPAGPAAETSDEDAEIEEILRRRGIQ